MSMADRIIVLNEGKVMQDGTPSEIYASPKHPFVADFLGSTNWLNGCIVRGLEGTTSQFHSESGISFTLPHCHETRDGDCALCLRPERVSLIPSSAREATPDNAVLLPAKLIDAVDLGSSQHYVVRLTTGERLKVVALSGSGAAPQHGDHVQVAFDPADCLIFSKPNPSSPQGAGTGESPG
jgi:ABC-type Fe3+/spermidine/putrescine transport system ATPase subunit